MDLSSLNTRRGSDFHLHWWDDQSSANPAAEPLYVEALQEHVAQYC